MKKVCVLLASYDGQQWIKEQIDSILAQKNVKVDLFIFDDCSNDNTLKIIKDISKRKKNVYVKKNKTRLGSPTQNFFSIIKKVSFKKYDYVSLSDQDDIWNKFKLSRATRNIDTNKLDCYSSDVTILYDNRKTEYLKKSQNKVKMDFLFEGGGPGSTFVLNKKFAQSLKKNLIKNDKITKKINYHDWYIYFFARVNNYRWHIDNFSGLKYRQHAQNQLGANIGLKKRIKRAKYILSGDFLKQLKYFFILNENQKKKYKFLFSSNKFSTLHFIIMNFFEFRRKNFEKFICLFILFIFIFNRRKLI